MCKEKRNVGSINTGGRHGNTYIKSTERIKWKILLEGEEGVLVEHYHKLKTPAGNKTLDADFNKKIHAWVEANESAYEWEDRRSDGVQRECTRK